MLFVDKVCLTLNTPILSSHPSYLPNKKGQYSKDNPLLSSLMQARKLLITEDMSLLLLHEKQVLRTSCEKALPSTFL